MFAVSRNSLQVGLAVSSHVHNTLAGATFDHVEVSAGGGSSAGWTGEDVGAVAAAGSVPVLDGRHGDGRLVRARTSGAPPTRSTGSYQAVSGNFSIEAQVDSVENVNSWVKAGLMIRASHDPGSPHASVFATPTTQKGIAFQGRITQGGASPQAIERVGCAAHLDPAHPPGRHD